jgi:hypothetical protein
MCAHFVPPREGLTWDEVCELWDHGAFTTDEIKKIAPLFFEGAELSLVLDVIETVDHDSHPSEARKLEDKLTYRMEASIEAA